MASPLLCTTALSLAHVTTFGTIRNFTLLCSKYCLLSPVRSPVNPTVIICLRTISLIVGIIDYLSTLYAFSHASFRLHLPLFPSLVVSYPHAPHNIPSPDSHPIAPNTPPPAPHHSHCSSGQAPRDSRHTRRCHATFPHRLQLMRSHGPFGRPTIVSLSAVLPLADVIPPPLATFLHNHRGNHTPPRLCIVSSVPVHRSVNSTVFSIIWVDGPWSFRE